MTSIVDSYIEARQNYEFLATEINSLCEKWFNIHKDELLEKYEDNNDTHGIIIFDFGTVPNALVDNPKNPDFQYFRVCFTTGVGEDSRYHDVKVPFEEILNIK